MKAFYTFKFNQISKPESQKFHFAFHESVTGMSTISAQ